MPAERSTSNLDQTRWFSDEVQPHEAALRSYLKNSFPAVRDVDDVVQESLLRTWHAWAKQPINFPKAFLFKVARHVAIDYTRRDKISPILAVRDLDDLLVIEDGPSVVDTVSMQEKARILARAIHALPARCREVVILRKLKAMSQKEAATQLGIAEKTVEAQLARGIKRCESYLRKRGVHGCFTDE